MNLARKVLIIGGGFAGARVAQELSKQKNVNVTLVDRKDYFEVTYATMRGVTEPGNWGKRSRILYRDFIHSNFVQSDVTEIREHSVVLKDGKVLDFDYGVIATGSSYQSFPIGKSSSALTMTDRESEFIAEHRKLASAKTVLIVGGGPVGVEYAGEIADHFPELKVTLVHGGSQLLNDLSNKAGERAASKLKNLGVDVQLGVQLQKDETGTYHKVDGGPPIEADVVYECMGMRPNNSALMTHLSSSLDSSGRLKVDPSFRVEGCDYLFALGDIANVAELKLGYLADIQGAAVAKNILRLIRGKALKPYKTNPNVALIPVGRNNGLVQLPFGVTSLKFMVNMKQKDLFISKSFKNLRVAKERWPEADNSKE